MTIVKLKEVKKW